MPANGFPAAIMSTHALDPWLALCRVINILRHYDSGSRQGLIRGCSLVPQQDPACTTNEFDQSHSSWLLLHIYGERLWSRYALLSLPRLQICAGLKSRLRPKNSEMQILGTLNTLLAVLPQETRQASGSVVPLELGCSSEIGWRSQFDLQIGLRP